MLLPLLALAQSAALELTLRATREGEFVNVVASVDLPVDRNLVWGVLTDYAQYPRFVTSLSESRVSERLPEGVMVEQKGEFSFLFFTRTFALRMLVIEFPQQSVIARSTGGDFREFSSRYELLALGEKGVRLVYSARFIPDFMMPPLIGMAAIEHAMRGDFSQLAAEILRRGTRSDQARE